MKVLHIYMYHLTFNEKYHIVFKCTQQMFSCRRNINLQKKKDKDNVC